MLSIAVAFATTPDGLLLHLQAPENARYFATRLFDGLVVGDGLKPVQKAVGTDKALED